MRTYTILDFFQQLMLTLTNSPSSGRGP